MVSSFTAINQSINFTGTFLILKMAFAMDKQLLVNIRSRVYSHHIRLWNWVMAGLSNCPYSGLGNCLSPIWYQVINWTNYDPVLTGSTCRIQCRWFLGGIHIHWGYPINYLVPAKCNIFFKLLISEYMLRFYHMISFYEIALWWIPWNTFDDKSALV